MPGDDFRFALGHIERSAVRFHETGHEKQNERCKAPRGEDKPAWHNAKSIFRLRGNNPVRHKRAYDHHNREHSDKERQLVAEHLRDRAHRTEHGKFIVASPAGHKDCEFCGRSHGKEKKNATINCERRHVPAIRNHTQCEDRHGREKDWREKMDELIRSRRHNVFLDQHFDSVGDWLEKTERPDPVRAVAVLHPGKNFPLQYRDEREKREEHT